MGTDIVQARIELEALLDSFEHLENSDKQKMAAFQACGSGFDHRVRPFLVEQAAAAANPELRAYLEELIRRMFPE